ncbi:hypothetical protein FACS1894164_10910 [Spirochaetia bacterium]|nr:hypothetical protein FACS1894164_10910 [Spirochaetia bacterium]
MRPLNIWKLAYYSTEDIQKEFDKAMVGIHDKNFFIKNYEHKIVEDGKQLVDMIYLKMELE